MFSMGFRKNTNCRFRWWILQWTTVGHLDFRKSYALHSSQ